MKSADPALGREWMNLASFVHLEEAETLVDYMEERGFPTRLTRGAPQAAALWGWFKDGAVVHVQVDRDRIESAEAYFEASGEPARRALRCPGCQGSRVDRPATGWACRLPRWITEGLLRFLEFPMVYRCEDCHFIWQQRPGSRPDNPPPTQSPPGPRLIGLS